jgi:hypothetical protein
METESNTQGSLASRLFAREAWIGPAWAFVCSVTVALIGRALNFEYRHEVSSAVFCLVLVLVTTHYNGRLRRRPVTFAGLALVSAIAGVAIARWGG